VLILANVARHRRTMTSLLKLLSMESGVPLSTLKLNARILREFNLITYGSMGRAQEARLSALGSFIIRLLDDELDARVIVRSG